MPDNVVRFIDPEHRSRNPDACQPRNPADATVVILPVVRRFNSPTPTHPLDDVVNA